jgi:molecular chaperone DnaK
MAKLNTRNLQAGIDLGTTNSAIAIMQPEGIIVPEVGGGEILLPSCVYFDEKKNFFVGQEALNKVNADDKINGHIEFKRKMGTNYAYSVNNINSNLRPEELSGLVLNKLRTVYNDYLGEELFTAVITVPAKFDLRACQATRIAAMGNYPKIHHLDKDLGELEKSHYYASFLHAEILMEPIAASLSYGLNNDNAINGNWLVYDFGGGTFDAAIVNNYNGGLNVKHHAGDNFLGGKNLDEALLEYIINEVLTKEYKYDLEGFFKLAKYTAPRAYMKWMVEKAKKELSTEKEVEIIIPRPEFTDNKGKSVKAVIPVTRAKYISLAGPIYLKSIEIVENLLMYNKLSRKDIDRIILVGGPTKFPWLKEQLETILKIGVDDAVDPMTAIAKGAAIQAALSSPQVSKHEEIIKINTKTPVDCFLDINSDKTTTEVDYLLSGRITAKNGSQNDIEAIIFERSDQMWSSGNITVGNDGTFIGQLLLNESELNNFHLKLLGKNGTSFALTPNEFQILHNKKEVGAHDIAPYSLNVTIKDGFCIPVVKKAARLPAEETETFQTTKDFLKENKNDIITIELTEGESVYAENNTKVGELIVSGHSLSRNLPVNSDLFITIKETPDRNVFASCYIPYTRQTFEAEIKIIQSKPTKDATVERINKLRDKFQSVKNDKELLEKSNMTVTLNKLKFDEKINELNQLSDKAESDDTDNLMKANQQVSENLQELEKVEHQIIFTKLKEQIEKIKFDKEIYQEFKDEIDDLEEKLSEAETNHNFRIARSIEQELLGYDLDNISFQFVAFLYYFSFTKLYDFQKIIIELNEMIRKELLKNIMLILNIPPEIQHRIDTFNNGIRTINNQMENGKLASISNILNTWEYSIKQIYNDNINRNDTYPDRDYEEVIKILNNVSLTDKITIINKVLKITASGPLLTTGRKCVQAIIQKNISSAKILLKEFQDLYYVNQDLIGKIAPIPGGPGFTVKD